MTFDQKEIVEGWCELCLNKPTCEIHSDVMAQDSHKSHEWPSEWIDGGCAIYVPIDSFSLDMF